MSDHLNSLLAYLSILGQHGGLHAVRLHADQLHLAEGQPRRRGHRRGQEDDARRPRARQGAQAGQAPPPLPGGHPQGRRRPLPGKEMPTTQSIANLTFVQKSLLYALNLILVEE